MNLESYTWTSSPFVKELLESIVVATGKEVQEREMHGIQEKKNNKEVCEISS